MTLKKRIFLISALLYVLYTIFPLFADVFNIPVWIPSLVAFFIMLMLYPRAYVNRIFSWFLVYALVLVMYFLLGWPLTIGIGTVTDDKKLIIEFAYILPTISIFCILYYLKDEVLLRKLINWSIGLLFVSFIVAVPLMLQYGSLRAVLSEEGKTISVIGLPNYSLMHAYTLFLPVMSYGTKVFEKRKKLWMWVGVLVLGFVIYETFVTTSLVIMIALFFFTLMYLKENKGVWVVFSVLLVVIYALYKYGFFIHIIDWMIPAFEGTPVEPKLNDFKDSMLQGKITGGTIVGRQNLHDVSWYSFFQNPLFGTSVVGGHSSLIDRFGGMGIVAGIPFLMIFVSFIRQMVKQYSTKTAKVFFWVGILVGFIFLYEKALWGSESWLMYMVLMPMGILTFERKSIELKHGFINE